MNVQGDQKVSVHLMITIQKVTSNAESVPRQSRHLLTRRTVLSKTVFSIACFLYCNRQVHRDFLITLYVCTECIYVCMYVCVRKYIFAVCMCMKVYIYVLYAYMSVSLVLYSYRRVKQRTTEHFPHKHYL